MNENLEKYINSSDPYTYIERQNTEIKDGSVYIVKADGTGIIYNPDNTIRETF